MRSDRLLRLLSALCVCLFEISFGLVEADCSFKSSLLDKKTTAEEKPSCKMDFGSDVDGWRCKTDASITYRVTKGPDSFV